MANNQQLHQSRNGKLGVIALTSCQVMGEKIKQILSGRRDSQEDCLITTSEIRFSNGEGKIVLEESVRGKDAYILCDVGNYSCTYEMFGIVTHKGPDEHFQDIKRAVSAICGVANRITVIMPLLYSARQHRRKLRESLDCAIALQELERLGVDTIVTFDAHDPNVQNAVPLTAFINLYPTYEIIKRFLKEPGILPVEKDKLIVISPDTGAMDRSIYYSSVLGVDVGMFYKRRDYSRVVGGKNPIVQFEYMGKDLAGMSVLITDDMISSGGSVAEIVRELKRRKAQRIYVAVTFALFTEGIEPFEQLYREGLLEGVFSTNLTYIPPQLRSREWFREVDMSSYIAKLIHNLNQDIPMATINQALSAEVKAMME